LIPSARRGWILDRWTFDRKFFYFSCHHRSATLFVTLGNDRAAKASLHLRAVPTVMSVGEYPLKLPESLRL
jgi:hypothetical protein